MNNVLVVDDEPIIAQGIFNKLSEIRDCELSIWKAYSVRDAIKILEQNRIDILITDIRMPEMSGLDLTQIVSGKWKHCKIIFLSGYSDTEYLQFALRQGVFDYLIKPVEDEKLIETLKNVIIVIEQESRDSRFLEKARAELGQARQFLRSSLMYDILESKSRVLDNLQEHLDFLQIPLSAEQSVLLMVGRVDRWEKEFLSGDKLLIHFAINNIVEEYLNPCCEMLVVTEGRYMVWLLQDKKDMQGMSGGSDKLHLYTVEILEKVQESVRQLLNLKFSIVLSQPGIHWRDLSGVYSDMCSLLQRGIGLEEEIILIDNSSRGSLQNEFSTREIKRKVYCLETWLESGEQEVFIKELAAFLEEFQKPVFVEYSLQMQAFCSLAGMFLSFMNTKNITEEICQEIDLEPMSNFSSHLNWFGLKKYFIKTAESIFQKVLRETSDQKGELVDKVDQYILNNLGGDLSLTNLSRQVHISSCYLSRLYQSQKGSNLSQRIIEMKISKAKELISAGSLKIHEIAQVLGFDNIPYFTKFFKKHVGVTPQDFKDSNRV